MKKLITFIAILLLTTASFAQDLSNQFYFRFGYSSPSWTQYGMEKDDWGTGTTKTGATFELGSIFMLKGILNSENMSLGINADYLYLTYGNFAEKWMELTEFDLNYSSLRIGSKIGPSFTYSPTNKIAIDVYAKADIAWGAAAAMYVDDPGDANDYYVGYGTLGFSSGLNFRYGLLIVGFEFNTISPKLESEDYPGKYLGNFGESIHMDYYPENNGDKSSLPCMNFTIGMSF